MVSSALLIPAAEHDMIFEFDRFQSFSLPDFFLHEYRGDRGRDDREQKKPRKDDEDGDHPASGGGGGNIPVSGRSHGDDRPVEGIPHAVNGFIYLMLKQIESESPAKKDG